MTLDALVAHALAEDLAGAGDVTTESCVGAEVRGAGTLIAKQDLVLSGGAAASATFAAVGVDWSAIEEDGSRVQAGSVVAEVAGRLRDVLTAERVALNFLMRLSGIATHTATVVAAAPEGLRVVDTRKSTPLHRALEKAAVRHGGAHNHRFGLFDGVLIKDNHVEAAGGVTAAVAGARAHAHHLLRIQLEVETLDQLAEGLACGVDAFLLDNMDDATLAEACRIVDGRALTEASGNMTAARIAGLGGIGLDQVSVGGLIHQARWVDVSLEVTRA